ncbi:MAG: hypothetical protein Q7J16_05760 [Candidatus Cloacimonadales bacterium]|nr:hypothetical protein [Candidatus Cloacimonadales bacterium]
MNKVQADSLKERVKSKKFSEYFSFSLGEGGPERFRDEVGLPREIQLAEYFIGDEAERKINFKKYIGEERNELHIL